MLNAIALDDEPIALQIIKTFLANINFINISAIFTNPYEAIQYLTDNKVDVIFLNINMPDISGIEFLKLLSNPPMVIFTTAFSEHAVVSFQLNAVDYLLKPYSEARFLQACNKVYELSKLKGTVQNASPSFIFLRNGNVNIKIELNDLLYVESNGNYLNFVLKTKKILIRLTLNEAEKLLPYPSFIRIHRSFLVSKEKITKHNRNSIWIDEKELPIGSAYLHNISKIIEIE